MHLPSAAAKPRDQAAAACLAWDSVPFSLAKVGVATCIRILENRLLLQEEDGSGLCAWDMRMIGTNRVSGACRRRGVWPQLMRKAGRQQVVKGEESSKLKV